MPCRIDYYRYALDCLLAWFDEFIRGFAAALNSKPLAILCINISMIPIAWLFLKVTRDWVPGLVKWYFDETIYDKAIDYWERKCRGLGFTHETAIISIAAGSVYYVLIRIAVGLPAYYKYSILALLVAFVGVHTLGCFVSGKVPKDRARRYRYFKRFQAPTITGIGLGVGTIALDFVIHAATIALESLGAITTGV